MSIEIIMPEMGEGVIEGTIARWLKKEGDAVAQYEPILEIETDKVTTEAIAETAGVLRNVSVKEGDVVPVGTVLATIETEQIVETAGSPAPTTPTAPPSMTPPVSAPKANGSAPRTLGRISPVVGRMADEHGIDLTQINGTGKNGRITKKDVLAYLKTIDDRPQTTPAPAKQPQVAPIVHRPPPIVQGQDNLVPHSSMRRMIAEHMVSSKAVSPHVTTIFDVDFSAVMAHRRANKQSFAQSGVKLTLTPYIMLAVAQALRRHPNVNSSWSDDALIQRGAINIGMATAIETGLIVPVIQGADDLNLMGMAKRVNDLADRARSNRLQPTDLQGGTFTVTNHGVSGSLFATPIINQPQTGILGVGKIEKRVVVVTHNGTDMMAIKPMSYLSFAFDHRVLDGATADAFVADVKSALENWR